MGLKARSWQGWQIPIIHLERARLGPHRRHRRLRDRRALRERKRGRGDRRLPGHHRDTAASPRSAAAARTPRRWRSRPRSRPTAATSIPTSTASTPPTRASCRRRSRLDKVGVRGDAGNGLARRQGAAGPLGRARHGPWRADLCALQSFDEPDNPQCLRHAHLRRGGNRGKAGRHRHRVLEGRSADFASAPSPTSRAWPRRSSGRWPRPTSMST
jgi:hypothetical protein